MRVLSLGTLMLASVLTLGQAYAQKSKKPATTPVANAEKVDINKVFKNWKPRNIGPASMSAPVS